MAMEEETAMSRPSTGEEQVTDGKIHVEDTDIEDGEVVVGDDESSSSLKPSETLDYHPLENSWTFWFDNPAAKHKQLAWGSSLCRVYTFSTVEQFWGVFNNIHRPSKLAQGADLYCFKDKIEPKWEDPICFKGGNWTVNFSRGKSDTVWLWTLLAMIGEQFDHGDDICGAVVNIRKSQEKISLWTKNASNEGYQVSIGRQFKEFLDYRDNSGFIFHEELARLDKSAKPKYTV